MKFMIYSRVAQFLVYNPITKQCIELLQLSIKSLQFSGIVCDFFEHDLQSSSYKIFMALFCEVYIYSSSSCKWQAVDSFSNFKFNFEYEIYDTCSCIMFKNNIYIAFCTIWMMVVYNPKDDAWNNLGLSINYK